MLPLVRIEAERRQRVPMNDDDGGVPAPLHHHPQERWPLCDRVLGLKATTGPITSVRSSLTCGSEPSAAVRERKPVTYDG
jgi:hypothetical protein